MDVDPSASTSSASANGQEHATTADADAAADDNGEAAGDGEDDEEEYEIEEILDHADGYWVKNQMAYLVSWVGYGADENCWIREQDAEGAAEMLADYWRAKAPNKRIRKISKTADRVWKEMESANGNTTSTAKKRSHAAVDSTPTASSLKSSRRSNTTGALAAASSISKPHKARLSTSALAGKAANADDSSSDEDVSTLTPEQKEEKLRRRAKRRYERIADWENIVKSIDTVEKTPEGRLIAFVTFEDDQKFAYDTAVVNFRCPQKVIALYESRLRFRAPTRGDVAASKAQQAQQVSNSNAAGQSDPTRTDSTNAVTTASRESAAAAAAESSSSPAATEAVAKPTSKIISDALTGRTRSPSLPTTTTGTAMQRTSSSDNNRQDTEMTDAGEQQQENAGVEQATASAKATPTNETANGAGGATGGLENSSSRASVEAAATLPSSTVPAAT